jgi:glycosyltransferase EpsF
MLVTSRITEADIDWTFYSILPQAAAMDELARAQGATVIHAPCDLKDTVTLIRHLRQTMRDGDFDILHCHHDVVSALYLLASVGVSLRQRIVHVHNADLHIPTASTAKAVALRGVFRRICLRLATDIVGISQHTLDYFVGGSQRKTRCDRVLYYGIDTASFRSVCEYDRTELRAAWHIKADAPVILFIGRLVWYKNPLFVLEVLDELRQTMPNVVAVFAGTGPEAQQIECRARELDLERNVRLLGWRDDGPRLMRAADLMVFPRVERRERDLGPEGLGLVVVEAQAAGLPILVSNGIPEDSIVLPQNCERLSLEAGAQAWAARARCMLMRERPDAESTVRALEESPFSLHSGFANLRAIYR